MNLFHKNILNKLYYIQTEFRLLKNDKIFNSLKSN
jgi:hypothetical protein